MAKKEKIEGNTVKKETMLIVAFVALMVGFLAGTFFGVYKSASSVPASGPAPMQQKAQEKEPTAEQDTSIRSLELETSMNPGNFGAWTQLGNLYFDTDQFEKAITAYKKSLELNPNNADVMTDLGVMYRRNGQPKEAIKAFDKAAEIDPTHETSRFNKGIVFMHDLNDLEGTIRAWEDLVQVNQFALSPTGQPVKELVEKLKESIKNQ
ncbi:tetratricopeptide repeat protein [Thermodesulfobacteriota bacterium]